ncbi:dihydroxyacetone kinase subunit DhaK [Hafnia alvei]|uniref:dihydroxyacetone kinase subunit DhaK n=1 Tax=Hafnia alvei TaxID=569 RepID=UPI0022392FA5|nr:dihydroxyacetone kinase subunit DhaK [Hafnia alvei]
MQDVVVKANFNTCTIGVALNGCALPQSDSFNFILGDDEIEVGIGIHGEPGLYRQKLTTADEIVDVMIERLCKDRAFQVGDRLCVAVNNLGALSNTELLVIGRRVGMALDARGLETHDVVIGHFCTSLEMSGFSISLMLLDDELQSLYDMPHSTLGWSK